jgi:hypothetical protein
MDKKTVFLAAWDQPKHHGRGKKLTIMTRTSASVHAAYVAPDGFVRILTPRADTYWSWIKNKISIEQFRSAYFECALALKEELKPGKLIWNPYSVFNEKESHLVDDGDTMCCSCGHSEVISGECHRAWAAVLLQEAGWVVKLDGKKLKDLR